jgi:hypothetical protein
MNVRRTFAECSLPIFMNNRKKTFLMYYHVPSLVPWLEFERSVNMG